MTGASDHTLRVAYVNANWTPGAGAAPGRFEVLVVTEDNARHSLPVSAVDMPAVIALTQAPTLLLWDPDNKTLIAGNLSGEWFQTDWEPGRRRVAGAPSWLMPGERHGEGC